MEFNVDPLSGVAIYQQLIDQICAALARGRLQPDQRLPSVREMSRTLVINPNTVARAYSQLENDGVLYTRPGLGVFVAPHRPQLGRKARRERLTKGVDALLIEAVQLGFAADEVSELVAQRSKQFQWEPVTSETS